MRQPKRGDVIVFQFPQDPTKDYIKRCIGKGGETIEIKNKAVSVNGTPLVEPYAIHSDPNVKPGGYEYRDNFGPFTVPPGEMFMMGDNRDNSNDSRYWGTLAMDLVKGRAMFLYWSWDSDRNWPRWNRILHPIR